MTPGSILSLLLLALALGGVLRATDQQIQQASVNIAICALAVRSGFFAHRRSDLQTRDAFLPAAKWHGARGSDIVTPSLS
jgi:hypothetical protein